MNTWPPPEIAVWREPERTPFERLNPLPPVDTSPLVTPPEMLPLAGVPLLWCRCGDAILARGRGLTTFTAEAHRFVQRWTAAHAPPLHRLVDDDYRAACRQHIGGCRNCGTMPVSPLRFYCSAACRTAFERDHFWSTARAAAEARQRVYDVATRRMGAMMCARCDQPCVDRWEVNHVRPLNGVRPFFGCMHHLDNLEVLDRACHLVVTGEQRAAGLIR